MNTESPLSIRNILGLLKLGLVCAPPKSPPSGWPDVEISVVRDGKEIKAFVEVLYYRAPQPEVIGDPCSGDNGEVGFGTATDEWGGPLTLSKEEIELAEREVLG